MAHVSSEVALFMHELQKIDATSAQRETASLWRAVHASRCTGPCKTMTARGGNSSNSSMSSNADGRSDGSSSSSGYKGCCCAVDVMLYQRVLLYTARVVQLALLRTQAPASVWPSYCVWFVAAMHAADTPQAAKLLHYAQHTLCAVLLYVPAPRNLYDEFVECRAKQQQQRCECAALVTGGSLGSMRSGGRRSTSPTTSAATTTTTTTRTTTVEWSCKQLTRLLCVLPPQHVTLPHATGTLHLRLRNPLHIPPFDFVVPGYKCDMCGLHKLYVAYQAVTCPYSSSRSNRPQQHSHHDNNNSSNDSMDDDRSYLELTGSGRAGYDVCVVCMAHYYRRQLRRLRSCLHAGRRRMHTATPVTAPLLHERSYGDCSAAVTANTVAAFVTTDVADVCVHDASCTTEMQWLVLPRDNNRCCCSGSGSGSSNVMGDSCYTTTTMATTVTADGKCRRRSTRSCLDTSLVTSSSGTSSHNNNNNNTLYMCDRYAGSDNIMTWCDGGGGGGGSTRAAVSVTDAQRSGAFDASALSAALRSLSLTVPETATRSLSSLHTLASSSMLTTTTTTMSTLGNTISTSLTMTATSNATMTASASRTAYSDATLRVLDDCDNVHVAAVAASSHIAMSGGSNSNDGSWRDGLLPPPPPPPPPRRPPSRYRSNSLDDTVAVAATITTAHGNGSGSSSSNDSTTTAQAEVRTAITTIVRKQDSDSDSSRDVEQDMQPLPHSNSRRRHSSSRGSGAHAVHKDRAARYSLTSSSSTTAATQTQSCNSSNNNSRRSSTAAPCSPLFQQQQQQQHAEQASSAVVAVVQPPHSRCLVLRRVTTITMRVGVAPRSARVIAWVLPSLPSPSTRDAGAAHEDGGGGDYVTAAANDTKQDSSISCSNSCSSHSDGGVVRVTHAARCTDDEDDDDGDDKDDVAFDTAYVARCGPPADWQARLRATPLQRNSNNSSDRRRNSDITQADMWSDGDGSGSGSRSGGSRSGGGAVCRSAQGRDEQRQQGDDNTTNTMPVRPASWCHDSNDGGSSRECSNNSSNNNSVNSGGVRVAAQEQPQEQRRGSATTHGATTPRAHDKDDDGHSRRHSHRHADNDDNDKDDVDDDGGRRGGEHRHDVCAICLGALDEQAPVLTTCCGHVLHVLCMQDYARVRHDTCPLCRCTPALPDMRVPAVLRDNVYTVTLALTDVEAQCTSVRVCVGALLTHDGRYDNASNIAALRIIRVPVSHS